MGKVVTIGKPPWSDHEMLSNLEAFASLYEDRPIEDNTGGMKSPHMFLAWFVLQRLQIKTIIESGVWLGQGTWFFERACPDAELHCIDPDLARIQYRSKRATYYDRDFSTIDWRHLDKERTVAFFDDHQNAYERVKTAKRFGFKHLIFEDNYPPSQGDCYSLKKAFMHSGFTNTHRSLKRRFRETVRRVQGKNPIHIPSNEVPPNDGDANYLEDNLDIYCELPPVFKTEVTRWSDTWDAETYPTVEPLLRSQSHQYQKIFFDDATSYTWMCYAKLR